MIAATAIAVGLGGPAVAGDIFASGAPEDPRIRFTIDRNSPARNHVTDTISFGAEIKVEVESEIDFNLDEANNEDESTLRPEVRLYAAWEPSSDFRAFTKLTLSRDWLVESPDDDVT